MIILYCRSHFGPQLLKITPTSIDIAFYSEFKKHFSNLTEHNSKTVQDFVLRFISFDCLKLSSSRREFTDRKRNPFSLETQIYRTVSFSERNTTQKLLKNSGAPVHKFWARILNQEARISEEDNYQKGGSLINQDSLRWLKYEIFPIQGMAETRCKNKFYPICLK